MSMLYMHMYIVTQNIKIWESFGRQTETRGERGGGRKREREREREGGRKRKRGREEEREGKGREGRDIYLSVILIVIFSKIPQRIPGIPYLPQTCANL